MAFSSKKLGESFARDAKTILFREIKDINSVPDLDKFLGQFFTDKEKETILKRIVIKDFLNSGKKYREIKKILDVSSNTISNVRDIIEKRGYGRNPDRPRKYSEIKRPAKRERHETTFPKYKGRRHYYGY